MLEGTILSRYVRTRRAGAHTAVFYCVRFAWPWLVSCYRYFYVANLNSGTAVLGKNLWSVYRAVMAPTRGIAEKRGEAFLYIYIYQYAHTSIGVSILVGFKPSQGVLNLPTHFKTSSSCLDLKASQLTLDGAQVRNRESYSPFH
jgi:hypothetical protein